MTSLSKSEIRLHWIVGIGMILMMGVGIYMVQTETRSLISTHKSVGIALFVFILARVILRLRKGWPEDVSTGKAWEHSLARVVHWVLILATLAMPLSGMFDSVMGGRGLSLFGLDLIGANIGANGRPEAINKALSDLGGMVHGTTAKVLIGAIALHVAGAFKHHIIDRDSTLKRMMGRS